MNKDLEKIQVKRNKKFGNLHNCISQKSEQSLSVKRKINNFKNSYDLLKISKNSSDNCISKKLFKTAPDLTKSLEFIKLLDCYEKYTQIKKKKDPARKN